MNIYDLMIAKKLSGGGGGGDITVESLSVNSNGTYTAPSGKAYSPVVANVPNTYTAGDEGKVVSSGALVAQTSQTIDTNGTYDTTLKNSVTVNVSGGAFTPTYAVIRPDAELVQSYSYDKLAVQDLSFTIPAYSTTATTIVTSENLDGEIIDFANYDYFVYMTALAYPIKSTTVHAAGALEYAFYNYDCMFYNVPVGKAKSFDGTISNTSHYEGFTYNVFGGIVYDSSASVVKMSTTNSTTSMSAGIFPYGGGPALTSSYKLTITTPQFRMSGSSSYFNQSDWDRVTDIRMQYKIAVYRVARSGNKLDGWSNNMTNENLFSCIANGGTLT